MKPPAKKVIRVYRLSCSTFSDNHRGYTFHATAAEAQKVGDDWMRDMKGYDDEPAVKIELCSIEMTPEGILRALNQLASHPDNG